MLYRRNPSNNPWCRTSQETAKKWETESRHWLAMLSYGSYFQKAQENLIQKLTEQILHWSRQEYAGTDLERAYVDVLNLQRFRTMQTLMLSSLTDCILRNTANMVFLRRDAVLSNLHPQCSDLQARKLRNACFKGPLLFPEELVTETEQMIKDNLAKNREEKQDTSSGYSRPHPYSSSSRGSSGGSSQPFRGRGRGYQGGPRGGATNFGRPQQGQGYNAPRGGGRGGNQGQGQGFRSRRRRGGGNFGGPSRGSGGGYKPNYGKK